MSIRFALVYCSVCEEETEQTIVYKKGMTVFICGCCGKKMEELCF